MSLPINKIKKINPNGTDYEIIPERLQNNGYEAVLPTLTADSTIALASQIPDISTKMNKADAIGTGSLSMNRAMMTTVGSYSTTLGSSNTAAGSYSLAEGYITGAFGNYSHAEGTGTTALDGGHAEGYGKSTSSTFKLTGDANTTSYTIASGAAPKVGTILSYGSGTNKKVARVNTVSSTGTTISMSSTLSSSALSSATVYICNGAAYGLSHAEGDRTIASNGGAHAEGYNTFASGPNSHAEGSSTVASGQGSHAEGFSTVASSQYQHVGGKYNIEDTADTYVEIVGNGASSARSNARTLDWSGNEYLAGNLRAAGLTDGTTTKTMTEILAGGGGGSSAPQYTSSDATTGSTFTIDPGVVYDFGTRGSSSVETVTLDCTTTGGVVGEYVLKVKVPNNNVIFDTNLSNLIVSTPLLLGVTADNDKITLAPGFIYLISVLGGVVSGVYTSMEKAWGIPSTMQLSYDGVLTFSSVSGANKYTFNGMSVSPSGTNVASVLSSGKNQTEFTINDTSGNYSDKVITPIIYKFSSSEIPTNLTLNSSTLSWTAPTLSGTGMGSLRYLLTNQGTASYLVQTGTSVARGTLTSNGFSEGDTVYVTPVCMIILSGSTSAAFGNDGYSIGYKSASIVLTAA